MRLRLLVATAAVLALSATAHADSYHYDFTGLFVTYLDDPYDSFQYDSPTLFTSNTLFDAACGGSICSVNYKVNDGEIDLVEPNSSVDTHTRLSASFFTLGTHTENGNNLSIVQAATPEPSSLALLTTGVFGLIGVARRRLMQN